MCCLHSRYMLKTWERWEADRRDFPNEEGWKAFIDMEERSDRKL